MVYDGWMHAWKHAISLFFRIAAMTNSRHYYHDLSISSIEWGKVASDCVAILISFVYDDRNNNNINS